MPLARTDIKDLLDFVFPRPVVLGCTKTMCLQQLCTATTKNIGMYTVYNVFLVSNAKRAKHLIRVSGPS